MLEVYDGTFFAHRHFHAIPAMTNKNGDPVNMLVGLSSAIHGAVVNNRPRPQVFFFDQGKCRWREKLVSTYKAHRERKKELDWQMPYAQQIIAAYGIRVWSTKGEEADDLAGTMATLAYAQDIPCRIITNDKDMNQLVKSDKIVVVHQNGTVMTAKKVQSKYGVKPSQFRDYLALIGDDSDGYPGMDGCGPVEAVKILEHGTLADLLADPSPLPEKLAAKLKKQRKIITACRKVATIKRTMQLPFGPTDCAVQPPDLDRLTELFEQLGLKAALKRLAEVKKRPAKGMFG